MKRRDAAHMRKTCRLCSNVCIEPQRPSFCSSYSGLGGPCASQIAMRWGVWLAGRLGSVATLHGWRSYRRALTVHPPLEVMRVMHVHPPLEVMHVHPPLEVMRVMQTAGEQRDTARRAWHGVHRWQAPHAQAEASTQATDFGRSTLRVPSLSTTFTIQFGMLIEKRVFISCVQSAMRASPSSTVMPGFQWASSSELTKKPA